MQTSNPFLAVCLTKNVESSDRPKNKHHFSSSLPANHADIIQNNGRMHVLKITNNL